MLHWKESILPETATLLDVMTNLNLTGTRIVGITNAKGILLGIITDGDLRRALIRGHTAATPVSAVMRREFISARADTPDAAIVRLMREKSLLQIPVLDDTGRLVDLKFLADLALPPQRANWVVLMAGGLGQRLLPLTQSTPKPMLKVGGRPVLENILESFIEYGFHKFFISVNYLSEKIENYFGNGAKYNVEIEYLREKSKLGTAGALSLLPAVPDLPIVVMNGDVLTGLNFAAMLDFHNLNQAAATMGVREYSWEVPYGVIKTEGNRLSAIEEKPVQHYFVNAGIYVLSPEALAEVPATGTMFDMPSLFEKLMAKGKTAAAYPIREYWLDIGRPQDLERAKQEYAELFGTEKTGREQSEETADKGNADGKSVSGAYIHKKDEGKRNV